MRKTITSLLCAAVLAVPVADAWAAAGKLTAKAKRRVVVVTKRVAGSVAQVDRWGSLQVTIVVRKTTTTTGTRKRVTRKITDLAVPVYPNHTDRSVYINHQALPYLRSEALQAQSANVSMVSGATDTSNAFAQSLQAAILAGKRF